MASALSPLGTASHADSLIQPRRFSLLQALDIRHAKAAGKTRVGYGFHVAIAGLTPAVLWEIPKLPDWGVMSVKQYMAFETFLAGVLQCLVADVEPVLVLVEDLLNVTTRFGGSP